MNMLRAGAAKADITPKEALLPLPLLGPLQFTRINDHIFVRVLALESGNRRALVASFDLTFVPDAEGYKEALFAAFHIPRSTSSLPPRTRMRPCRSLLRGCLQGRTMRPSPP